MGEVKAKSLLPQVVWSRFHLKVFDSKPFGALLPSASSPCPGSKGFVNLNQSGAPPPKRKRERKKTVTSGRNEVYTTEMSSEVLGSVCERPLGQAECSGLRGHLRQ